MPHAETPPSARTRPDQSQSKLHAVLRRTRDFCVRHGAVLRIIYALCWALLLFRQSFHFNERFFRIPLLLLSLPVLAGLPLSGAARFLARSPATWAVVLISAAAICAGLLCPFPDVRSYSHLVFGWGTLALAGFTLALAWPGQALRITFTAMACGQILSIPWAFFAKWAGLIDNTLILEGCRWILLTGYPSTLGLISGFALIGIFFFKRRNRALLGPRLDYALMGGCAFLLLMSQARIAVIGVITALVFDGIRTARRPLRALGVSLLALALTYGAIVGVGHLTPLKNTFSFQRLYIVLLEPGKDRSVMDRLSLWDAGWQLFKERPFSGWGLRMFPAAHVDFMERRGAELEKRHSVTAAPGAGHAHNLALGALSEMGIFAFAALALIFLYVLARRGIAPGSDPACLQALFVYFFMQGLPDYMLHKIIFNDLFFGSLGLFMGAIFLQKAQKKAAVSP